MNHSAKPSEKPLLRGHFHQSAFFFALGACSVLLAGNHQGYELLAVLVYSLGLCGLLGVSALYHRAQWSPKRRLFMRKLDHAFIFILIAATSTPICLLALSQATAWRIMVAVWVAAAIGVAQSLFWVNAPKALTAFLCVVAGWIVVPYVDELQAALGLANIILIIAGGVIYTLGALTYALKFPNPSPRYFGYHEIFHIMVIVGALVHFLVIYDVVTR